MPADRPPTAYRPRFTPPTETTQYSVKRAETENESLRLVERVAVAPRASRPAGALPRWRAEVADDRVTLRSDGVQIELSLDDARRLAETILRGK